MLAPTAEVVRSWRSRSRVLEPAGRMAAVTRPETVFVSVSR